MKYILKIPRFFVILIAELIESFFRNIPYRLSGNTLRAFYYRQKFHQCGKNTYFFNGSYFYFPELISFGDNCYLNQNCILNPGPSPDEGPCLIFGEHCYIGPNCYFRTANHRFDNPDQLIMEQGLDPQKIIFGNDIWAGANCVFLPGAQIGDHSIIAAGSVVSSPIPPYSVVAGNPARVIKKRKMTS